MNEVYIKQWVELSSERTLLNGLSFGLQTTTSEVNAYLKEIYQHLGLNYSKFFKMDALCKLGFLATELLIKDSKPNGSDYENALVFSNRSSSLHTDLKFQQTLSEIPSPAVFVYTLPNIVIGEISIKNNFKGESALFVQNQWDVNFTVEYVKILFNTTSTQNCFTEWLDVDTHGEFIARLLWVGRDKTNTTFTTSNITEIYK
jgi:hypothetical protein